jgi:hypothetical protein
MMLISVNPNNEIKRFAASLLVGYVLRNWWALHTPIKFPNLSINLCTHNVETFNCDNDNMKWTTPSTIYYCDFIVLFDVNILWE